MIQTKKFSKSRKRRNIFSAAFFLAYSQIFSPRMSAINSFCFLMKSFLNSLLKHLAFSFLFNMPWSCFLDLQSPQGYNYFTTSDNFVESLPTQSTSSRNCASRTTLHWLGILFNPFKLKKAIYSQNWNKFNHLNRNLIGHRAMCPWSDCIIHTPYSDLPISSQSS